MSNKNFLKKIVAIFCVFTFSLYVTPAYAEDTPPGSVDLTTELKNGVVTQVKKGELVPFDGVLLSTKAAAKMYGELKFFEEECKLTLSKELEIQKIKYDTELNVLKLKLDVETPRTEKLLDIKDRIIQFLEKNWKPTPWYESGEFWLAIGVVSGVLLTVGAGYAIGQAGK